MVETLFISYVSGQSIPDRKVTESGEETEEKGRTFRMKMLADRCVMVLTEGGHGFHRFAPTSLRCRSAPPVRDFGLEGQAGFWKGLRH